MYLKNGDFVSAVIGKCPVRSCRDIPDGEWFDGSEFEHHCGVELVAVLHHDKDGTGFWKFRRAYERARRRKA
jgi:hypothetical protein